MYINSSRKLFLSPKIRFRLTVFLNLNMLIHSLVIIDNCYVKNSFQSTSLFKSCSLCDLLSEAEFSFITGRAFLSLELESWKIDFINLRVQSILRRIEENVVLSCAFVQKMAPVYLRINK